MTNVPPLILMVLWFLWVLQAMFSAMRVRKFRRLYDKPPREAFDRYRPTAVVVVPFKGLDHHMAQHVAGLFEQDYPEYELLLVVDAPADPAYAVLVEAVERYGPDRAQVLVAGPAGPDEGQKIHNQLFAIDHLLARQQRGEPLPEAWVFADSDAVPGPGWLASLVGPLVQDKITGVTTGYRWLIPIVRDTADLPGRASVWSHLASVMNSSVACLLGRDKVNHAWGGSMAVKASTALRGDLHGRLVGALCDDYQFSRMSRDLGLRVYFVPRCLVATPVDFDWRGLVNFVHRQYLLTRVYAPRLFVMGLILPGLYAAGCFSAWGWVLVGVLSGAKVSTWLWPACAIAAVFVANQLRAGFRQQAVTQAFGQPVLKKLGWTLQLDRWGTTLWMTLHGLLILRAAFGRNMRWRGITYRLWAPQRVKRLD